MYTLAFKIIAAFVGFATRLDITVAVGRADAAEVAANIAVKVVAVV